MLRTLNYVIPSELDVDSFEYFKNYFPANTTSAFLETSGQNKSYFTFILYSCVSLHLHTINVTETSSRVKMRSYIIITFIRISKCNHVLPSLVYVHYLSLTTITENRSVGIVTRLRA
jgi:hypothetical protein